MPIFALPTIADPSSFLVRMKYIKTSLNCFTIAMSGKLGLVYGDSMLPVKKSLADKVLISVVDPATEY